MTRPIAVLARLTAGAVAAALALAAGATSASATPVRTAALPAVAVSVSAPASVLPGGSFTVTGALNPKRSQTVQLQRKDSRGWTTIASVKATSGKFSLRGKGATAPAKQSWRVHVPATSKSRVGDSRTFTVATAKATPSLKVTSAPAATRTSAPLTVTANTSGTRAVLEHLSGTRWVALSTVTPAKGVARFSVTSPKTATSSKLRVRVPATTTTNEVASAAWTWTVSLPPAVPVTAKVAQADFITGESVTVTGTVGSVPAGTVVTLERLGTTWAPVATTKTTTAAGAYTFTVPLTGSSDVQFRTKVGATLDRKESTSPTTLARAYRCTSSSAPAGGLESWFNDPVKGTGWELSEKYVRTLCAATSGSTVRASVYFAVPTDANAAAIIRALKYVAVARGVKVNLVVEGSAGGTSASAIATLKKQATVSVCDGGCVSNTPGAANMHDKVLMISDTSWVAGQDNVVVVSSTNWSDRQLRQYWQVATLFHDDKALYAKHIARFDLLATCAVDRTRCVPPADGGGGATDAGRGTVVAFSPQPTGDNVAELFKRVTCTKGGSIRMAIYVTNANRIKPIVTELTRLVSSGCDVRMVLNDEGGHQNPPEAIAALKGTEMAKLECVTLMHAKFTTFTNVGLDGVTGTQMLMSGSQNWTKGGLRSNDDNTFTLTTAGAAAARVPAINTAVAAHAADWDKIAAQSHPCV